MAPSPQEQYLQENGIFKKPSEVLKGEEVVISGMSGIFPKSNSTLEFMENLYNKVDMVTDEDPRWKFVHPEVPKHLGKVNGMGKFDAQFFRVHYKQACTMEPMSRKLLEHAYGAIYDSGINPLQLQGKKVGVFIGSTFSESEKIVIYETIQRNGFGITGCNKAMYANRISYWIDGKGPSYALDIACASSMACLEHAYRSISKGLCDAAIVGGCNLCKQPHVSLNMRRAGFLCLDGKTKSFDKNGDGYVRSDAISVLFVQKAKDARRIYSEVYHAASNFSKPIEEFLPIKQSKDIQEFLEMFYAGIDVSPKDVEYIEAHGSGIAEGDGNELEAIGKIFAKDTPIRVGSVKSNMGHSEPASGVCALTKVCLAYHKGVLPANLHYRDPQEHISSVRDGKIEVLQDHVPFNRGFTALNSFSYTGVNVHVLLKGHYKPKDNDRYKSSIPRLVLTSGRQENCVTQILNTLKSQPLDPEQLGLLHNIHQFEIPGHMCRGFTVLESDNGQTVCLTQKVDYYSGETRPVWFVYSGMGSQWASMGADLMKIPIFAAAIERCHRALEPKGIDILKIITEPDKTIYDNILNSFVGIAAVQIGLTDILKALGIVPDNIIGHSVGELGCAYADGCFTAEEMILSAYSRGLVSVQTPFIRGSMAAVGLGFKAVQALCPPEIEVACHNSSESATISGPADIMKKFVEELSGQGIFAKEVPCSNIAYHSRYIAEAGPGLLKYLSEVIKNPKPRSKKWVSTSVPQDQWDQPKARYCSAEYHTNNLLNPVLFEETAKLIPENALVIEIAPHGLLQAILKRSHSKCVHVPLTRRGHSSPVQFLLEGIGKLYQEGLNPKVDALYPKIELPVSTETAMLSHMVGWEHSENWPQGHHNIKNKVTTMTRNFVVSIHDDDYKYLEGHVRDGLVVFPEAALLVLIWETMAMIQEVDYRKLSVVIHDVHFHKEAIIQTEEPLRLQIMIHKGDNKFEISNNGVEIVTGVIKTIKQEQVRTCNEKETKIDKVSFTSDDVYKILSLRGYSYKNDFKSILSSNSDQSNAKIKWDDEWITFLDGLIQLNALACDHDGVSVVKLIKKLTINTGIHDNAEIITENLSSCYQAELLKTFGVTRCAGVTMEHIVFTDKPKVEKEPDLLKTKSFIPHFLTGEIDVQSALLINLQVAAENIPEDIIKIAKIGIESSNILTNAINDAVEMMPSSNFEIISLNADFVDQENKTDYHFVVAESVLSSEKKMKSYYDILPKKSFVLSYEDATTKIMPKYKYFNIITTMSVQKNKLVLLRKANEVDINNVAYVSVSHDGRFSWVPRVESELKKTKKVVLVSERQTYCGVLGMIKTLSKTFAHKVAVVVVDDYLAPSFNAETNLFKDQLQKDLTVNVLKKGHWGSYYYLPVKQTIHLSNVKLEVNVPGDIDSLTWTEAPTIAASNMKVQISYAGPCLRDAHKAVGKIKSDNKSFGMDFSGIDCKGDRVMGLISGGAMASTIEADPNLIWPVPEHWSLEDAATVPLPYLHAYYCLTKFHPLISGQSVFVNGGSGAFGQAIISICLASNCPVYTSVSNMKKKQFLLQRFPSLKAENVTCSRHDTFYQSIIKNTRGKRCNHVISSLQGYLRSSAMKCVGFAGIFHDVSDCDKLNNKDFGMTFLNEERNYHSVNLSNLFKPENTEQRKKLQLRIAEGIARGVVRPISRVVYTPREVTRAFRLLSLSRHQGRVLIRMRDPVILNQGISVKPKMTYSSANSYVIICDKEYTGVELADHLVKKGARNILIHLNSGNICGYIRNKLISWKNQNVSIVVSKENLQTEQGCCNLFKEATKLGPVDGLFIVQDKTNVDFEHNNFVAKFADTGLILANFDFTSRNACTDLKYFVVLVPQSNSVVDAHAVSLSEKICQSRNELGLPATVVHYNIDRDAQQNTKQVQSLPTLLNALETSLKLKYDNVISCNLKNQVDSDFLQKITRILGVKTLDDIPENVSLKELDLTEINIEEIKNALRAVDQEVHTNEYIEKLTVANVKRLGQASANNNKFDSGLGAFYTFIDKDECMATEPMLPMATKFSSSTETEEVDPKATYMMLIPGFEGHHQIFTPICERLKVQAMAFQLGPDLPTNSIQDMALTILKLMKKRVELKSKFYLLGYSFGINVALELAALLEKEGHVGVVYCLDSSPDSLRAQLDAYLGRLTDTQLQNVIIKHLYQLMAGEENAELNEDLNRLEKWEDKVETCVIRLRGLVDYSHEYKRTILESAFKRIKLTQEYKPDFKLNSEIVLLKGIPHPKLQKLEEDYSLSKYSSKPIKIFDLKSEHAMAPYDCRVSNIINKMLDPVLLEEFQKQNLCDTYFADPFKLL